MNKILESIILMLLIGFQSVTAQTEFEYDKSLNIGFGVAFYDVFENGFPNIIVPLVYFPIDVGKFMIEPSASYFKEERTRDDINFTDSDVTVGLGLFHKANYERTVIYYGLRFYQRREKEERYPPLESSLSTLNKSRYTRSIAPTIGGHYFFSSHFSLGGDVSFQRDFLETSEDSDDYGPYDSYDRVTINATKIRIVLRYFL